MVNHILKTSLEGNYMITIIYQKGSQITKRNIRVLEMNGDSIKAFCYLRNQRRVFKIENILSAGMYKSNSGRKRVPLAAGI